MYLATKWRVPSSFGPLSEKRMTLGLAIDGPSNLVGCDDIHCQSNTAINVYPYMRGVYCQLNGYMRGVYCQLIY